MFTKIYNNIFFLSFQIYLLKWTALLFGYIWYWNQLTSSQLIQQFWTLLYEFQYAHLGTSISVLHEFIVRRSVTNISLTNCVMFGSVHSIANNSKANLLPANSRLVSLKSSKKSFRLLLLLFYCFNVLCLSWMWLINCPRAVFLNEKTAPGFIVWSWWSFSVKKFF